MGFRCFALLLMSGGAVMGMERDENRMGRRMEDKLDMDVTRVEEELRIFEHDKSILSAVEHFLTLEKSSGSLASESDIGRLVDDIRVCNLSLDIQPLKDRVSRLSMLPMSTRLSPRGPSPAYLHLLTQLEKEVTYYKGLTAKKIREKTLELTNLQLEIKRRPLRIAELEAQVANLTAQLIAQQSATQAQSSDLELTTQLQTSLEAGSRAERVIEKLRKELRQKDVEIARLQGLTSSQGEGLIQENIEISLQNMPVPRAAQAFRGAEQPSRWRCITRLFQAAIR